MGPVKEQDSDVPNEADEPEERTWSDLQGQAGSGQLVGYAQDPQAKHRRNMQAHVLWGLGGVFLITLLTVVFGVGTKLISEDFGRELVRVILPTVLGSATTIVGVLFVNDRKQR